VKRRSSDKTVSVAAVQPGQKYTTDPNEVPAQITTPAVRDVVSALLAHWAGLTEQGARTITAQFASETGWGAHCFNWNLGNMKSHDPTQLYAYRRDVWECRTQSQANSDVANGAGNVHIATAGEIQQHKWKCPDVVVVFEPPHVGCRFRAFASLQDGAQGLVDKHKKIAASSANYFAALNAGDVAGVAHALKIVGYYTASEADYARTMGKVKNKIDSDLGPAH